MRWPRGPLRTERTPWPLCGSKWTERNRRARLAPATRWPHDERPLPSSEAARRAVTCIHPYPSGYGWIRMIRQLPSAPPRRGLPAVGKAVQCGFEELESDYEWRAASSGTAASRTAATSSRQTGLSHRESLGEVSIKSEKSCAHEKIHREKIHRPTLTRVRKVGSDNLYRKERHP